LPILQGGGTGSQTLPNHVIRKQTVNTTLTMGHQSDPAHCQKFPISTWPAVHQIKTEQYNYFDWGRQYRDMAFPMVWLHSLAKLSCIAIHTVQFSLVDSLLFFSGSGTIISQIIILCSLADIYYLHGHCVTSLEWGKSAIIGKALVEISGLTI
jgi:hypothetical protein